MTPDERDLLTDLKRACDQAPGFVLEFLSGDMPVDAEEAYAHRLVDVAEMLMLHARARKRLIIDSRPTTTTTTLHPARLSAPRQSGDNSSQ